MKYLILILGVLLAVSAAGNAYQYHEHTVDSVKFGTTSQLAADTKTAAEACGASVDSLATENKKQGARILDAMGRIAPTVAAQQRGALEALAAKPDDAKDLCGSLLRFWEARLPLQPLPAGGQP